MDKAAEEREHWMEGREGSPSFSLLHPGFSERGRMGREEKSSFWLKQVIVRGGRFAKVKTLLQVGWRLGKMLKEKRLFRSFVKFGESLTIQDMLCSRLLRWMKRKRRRRLPEKQGWGE